MNKRNGGEKPHLEQETKTKSREELLKELEQKFPIWESILKKLQQIFNKKGKIEYFGPLRIVRREYEGFKNLITNWRNEAIELTDEKTENLLKPLEERLNQFEEGLKSLEEVEEIQRLLASESATEDEDLAKSPEKSIHNPGHEPKPELEEERRPRKLNKRDEKGELIAAEAMALIERAQALGVSEKKLRRAGTNVNALQKLIDRHRRQAQKIGREELPDTIEEQPQVPETLPREPEGDRGVVIRETHVTAQPRPNIGEPKREEGEEAREEKEERNEIGKLWDIVEHRLPRRITDQEFQEACKRLKEHYLDLYGQATEKEFRREMEARLRRVEDLKREWDRVPSEKEFPPEQMSRTLEREVITGRDKENKPITAKLLVTIDRIKLTKLGREWGMKSEDMAKLDLLELAERVGEGREGAIRISRSYKELESLFLQGMSIEEMGAMIRKMEERKIRPYFVLRNLDLGQLVEAGKIFEADLKSEKNNPLLRVADRITRHFAPSDSSAKPHQVWDNFVYGAKLERETGRPSREIEARDPDVNVCVWLLKQAGFKNWKKARAVRQGEVVPGVFHLDTGGRAGAFFEEGEKSIFGVDNHPRGREYPTSAAKVLFGLLKSKGYFSSKNFTSQELRAIGMVVEYTVNSDNASFPSSKEGRRADFLRSEKTMLGIGHLPSVTPQDLYRHFLKYGGGNFGSFSEAYTYATVSRELSEEELRGLGVLHMPGSAHIIKEEGKRRQLANTEQEKIKSSVEQTEEIFGKKNREELEKEGYIMRTRFGTYMVGIVLPGQSIREKILAGHNAAKAYGFDGYISINLQRKRNPSFMVNTLRRDVDFSKDEKICELEKRQEGSVIVRGCMFIKPANLKQLQVRPRELFEALLPEGQEKDWQPGTRIARLLEYDEHPEIFRLREEFARKAKKLWEQMARNEMEKAGLSPEEIEQHLGSYTLRDRMERVAAESADLAIKKLKEQGYVR